MTDLGGGEFADAVVAHPASVAEAVPGPPHLGDLIPRQLPERLGPSAVLAHTVGTMDDVPAGESTVTHLDDLSW